MKRLALLSLAVLLLSTGAGCRKLTQRFTEKAIEKATGGAVEVKDDGVSIQATGQDGEPAVFSAGRGAKLPEDFPKEVPLYPGAKITAVMSMGAGHTVTLTTSDDRDAVIGYYKKQLSGFKQLMAADTEEAQLLSLQKDKLTVNVSASRNGPQGQTVIALVISRQES